MSDLSSNPVATSTNTQESMTLAGLLMAAVLAALLVVADQLIDSLAEGHLLVSWVDLWVVAFTALAWLAQPLRRVTRAMAQSFARRAREEKMLRTESQLWECVQYDRRSMQDLMQTWQRSNA